MNIIIVYSHPSPTSLNAALKDTAVSVLERQGHTVKVSDLYEMKFKAIADQEDFTALKNPATFSYINEQYYASQNRTFSKDILEEQDNLAWADYVIFQFPMWWTEAPAILKGWFDRVFAYGFAYGPGAYDKGNLRGKKAMLSFTTGGNDLRNFGKNHLKGELSERLFNIQHEKLYFVGLDVIEPFVFTAGIDEQGKKELFEQFEDRLIHLESAPVIPFRPVSDYENGKLKESSYS
ncbi:NAD(P)H-dependent oxidoreductase [Cytobacillus suaedae]|nr:NAD(P)H-dependent oxidoreductase [Cytobacillus suaedae]